MSEIITIRGSKFELTDIVAGVLGRLNIPSVEPGLYFRLLAWLIFAMNVRLSDEKACVYLAEKVRVVSLRGLPYRIYLDDKVFTALPEVFDFELFREVAFDLAHKEAVFEAAEQQLLKTVSGSGAVFWGGHSDSVFFPRAELSFRLVNEEGPLLVSAEGDEIAINMALATREGASRIISDAATAYGVAT